MYIILFKIILLIIIFNYKISFNNNKLNILPDLCNNNNFKYNYMNNLNHYCGSLNPVELKMKLNYLYNNNK